MTSRKLPRRTLIKTGHALFIKEIKFRMNFATKCFTDCLHFM